MQADILALDLSLTGTGWATLDRDGSVSTGRITTRSTGCDRIDYVLNQVTQLCSARLVAIEGPALTENLAYFHENAGLWWQVRMMLHRDKVNEVVVIGIGSLKKYATGKGNAGKDDVFAEAIRRFRDLHVRSKDEADALWMLAMCAERYGRELVDLPAVNRSAIHAVVPAKKTKPAHPAINWPTISLWEPAHV